MLLGTFNLHRKGHSDHYGASIQKALKQMLRKIPSNANMVVISRHWHHPLDKKLFEAFCRGTFSSKFPKPLHFHLFFDRSWVLITLTIWKFVQPIPPIPQWFPPKEVFLCRPPRHPEVPSLSPLAFAGSTQTCGEALKGWWSEYTALENVTKAGSD